MGSRDKHSKGCLLGMGWEQMGEIWVPFLQQCARDQPCLPLQGWHKRCRHLLFDFKINIFLKQKNKKEKKNKSFFPSFKQ